MPLIRQTLDMTSTEHELQAQLLILKAQIDFAMGNRDWKHSQTLMERYHELAQNRSLTHIESHVLLARLNFRKRKWWATGIQLYLAMMAPYGTAQRRRRSV